MKITFLGTSHGIAEKNQFCSSAAVTVEGKHYVIDAGAPLMTLLQNYDLAFTDVQGIFITHTHGDHNIGLVELTLQLNVFPHFKHVHFPVYVPDERKYRAMMDFLEVEEYLEGRLLCHVYEDSDGTTKTKEGFGGRLWYQVYGDGVIFDDGTLKVTAIPVKHIPNAHCFMLEAEGKRVFFTGDLRGDLSDFPKEICDLHSDLVVMEAAHCKLVAKDTSAILATSNTDHMIINHRSLALNPEDEFEVFKSNMSKHFAVDSAYDGLILEI